MKKIDTFIEGQMSPEDQDAYLQEIISEKFDAEYKAKWSDKLGKNNIYRSRQKKTKYGLIIAIAASICLLTSLFHFSQIENTPKQYADKYLTSDIYTNPAIKKGTNETSQKEILSAASAFNRKNWDVAQEQYLSIIAKDATDLESRFYLALSYFYDKEFIKSTEQFSILDSSNLTPDRKQEVNWFHGLSLLNEGKTQDSKKVLEKITRDDWKYADTQAILKDME